MLEGIVSPEAAKLYLCLLLGDDQVPPRDATPATGWPAGPETYTVDPGVTVDGVDRATGVLDVDLPASAGGLDGSDPILELDGFASLSDVLCGPSGGWSRAGEPDLVPGSDGEALAEVYAFPVGYPFSDTYPFPGEAPPPAVNPPAVAELNRLGLVRTATEHGGGLAVVDPSEAFTRLLAGIDRRAVDRHEELGRLLRVLDGLRLDDERGALAGEPGPILEVLTDPAVISRVIRQSRVAARCEYLAVVAAGPGGEPPLGWPDDVKAGAEAAPARVLYAGSGPRSHSVARPVSRVPGPQPRRAADVRYGPAAALDLRLIDQHTAILALAGDPAGAEVGGGTGAAIVVRSEPVVGLLRSCFLQLWEQAGGADTDPAGGGALTPFDRRIVGLLAAGHRDADIATLTGTSVRTVRRRIAVITQELGATSRFAAGVEAFRRGLVAAGPDGARGAGPAGGDRGPGMRPQHG